MLKHQLLHTPGELPRPDEDLTGIFTYPDGKHAALFVRYDFDSEEWLFLSTIHGISDIEVSIYCLQTYSQFTGWLYYSDYSSLLDALLSGESFHYRKVKRFMRLIEEEQEKAGIDDATITKVSSTPHEVPQALRVVRLTLLLEEVQELIEAMQLTLNYETDDSINIPINLNEVAIGEWLDERRTDLKDVADALADISVINTGTLIAFGLKDLELLNEVDENNLAKLTGDFSLRSDGKLLKPSTHTPPDIPSILKHLSQLPRELNEEENQ